jgi:hypothetical protein
MRSIRFNRSAWSLPDNTANPDHSPCIVNGRCENREIPRGFWCRVGVDIDEHGNKQWAEVMNDSNELHYIINRVQTQVATSTSTKATI